MENEKFEVLTQLIENKKYAEFMHAIDEINPVDAADFLMSLPEDKQLTAFRMLKKDAAADIFAELESDFQE